MGLAQIAGDGESNILVDQRDIFRCACRTRKNKVAKTNIYEFIHIKCFNCFSVENVSPHDIVTESHRPYYQRLEMRPGVTPDSSSPDCNDFLSRLPGGAGCLRIRGGE